MPSRRIARSGAFLAIAFLVAACARESAAPPAYATRDSAGVRIVEYADTPVASHTLSLAATPRFRVGDSQDERQFEFIPTAALLPDGSAVVVDGRLQQELLRIDAAGAVRVLAARGKGPSEVSTVVGLVALGGDSVLVQDIGNARLSTFVRDSLVRSVSVAGTELVRSASVVGYAGKGSVLARTSNSRPGPSEDWSRTHLIRFDLASGASDSVGAWDMVRREPRGRVNPFAPFGVVASGGPSFVVGRSDLPQVTWRDENGATRQIMRWKPRPVYPTEASREALIEQEAGDVRRANPDRPGLADAMATMIREQSQLDSSQPLPLFAFLEGDGRGGVWLSAYPEAGMRGSVRRWHHVADTGEWLGTLEIPEGFKVLDMNGNRVLATVSDSLGVESVAVFDITEVPRVP